MKKIIIALLILIAVLAIPPFFIGSQAESKVREMYTTASEYPNIKFEITEYNRGWFSSDVKIKLLLDVAGAPQSDEDTLIITQRMQHGPLLWKTDGLGIGLADIRYGVEFPREIQAEMDKIDGLKGDSVSVVSRLSFDGSSTSSMNIAPFAINKDNHQVNIKAGAFNAVVSMSGKIIASGNWEGMQVKENSRTLVDIDTLSMSVDQLLVDGEMFTQTALFEGDSSVGIKHLDINGYSPAETFKISEISFKSATKFKQELANIGFVLSAKKINAVGQEFTDLTYDLSLENINKDTVLAMNNLMLENGGPDELMETYQDLLPELVKKNPTVKLNKMGVTTSVGEINTNALITVNGEAYDEANLMGLIAGIDASASGYAPASFFDNFGMRSDIEMMVQENMLVRENEQIKFDVSFKNGQLMLNGNPMPMGF